jgi:hypothetical protein
VPYFGRSVLHDYLPRKSFSWDKQKAQFLVMELMFYFHSRHVRKLGKKKLGSHQKVEE